MRLPGLGAKLNQVAVNILLVEVSGAIVLLCRGGVPQICHPMKYSVGVPFRRWMPHGSWCNAVFLVEGWWEVCEYDVAMEIPLNADEGKTW